MKAAGLYTRALLVFSFLQPWLPTSASSPRPLLLSYVRAVADHRDGLAAHACSHPSSQCDKLPAADRVCLLAADANGCSPGASSSSWQPSFTQWPGRSGSEAALLWPGLVNCVAAG